MICQPSNSNKLPMLEKLSAQAIYYQPQSNSPTGISNTGDRSYRNNIFLSSFVKYLPYF